MSRASGSDRAEPVELGHHERVALAAGRQRLAQTGTSTVGARQALVDVDALRAHAQPGQCIALGGEVLLVGRDARVADQ